MFCALASAQGRFKCHHFSSVAVINLQYQPSTTMPSQTATCARSRYFSLSLTWFAMKAPLFCETVVALFPLSRSSLHSCHQVLKVNWVKSDLHFKLKT